MVYIARALVQETQFIVMNEPMSALDFSNQAMILKIISGLSDDKKTVILTSHNPNHALTIGAQVCLIDKQKNIIQGDASSVLCNQQNIENAFGESVLYTSSDINGHITFNL